MHNESVFFVPCKPVAAQFAVRSRKARFFAGQLLGDGVIHNGVGAKCKSPSAAGHQTAHLLDLQNCAAAVFGNRRAAFAFQMHCASGKGMLQSGSRQFGATGDFLLHLVGAELQCAVGIKLRVVGGLEGDGIGGLRRRLRRRRQPKRQPRQPAQKQQRTIHGKQSRQSSHQRKAKKMKMTAAKKNYPAIFPPLYPNLPLSRKNPPPSPPAQSCKIKKCRRRKHRIFPPPLFAGKNNTAAIRYPGTPSATPIKFGCRKQCCSKRRRRR